MYTVAGAAKVLGKSKNYVRGLISRGIVPVEEDEGVRMLTEEAIQVAERYARTIAGICINKPWLVSLLPFYYNNLSKTDKSAARFACAAWIAFMNGRWTTAKPRHTGVHLVKSLCDETPVYRNFVTQEQIENWAGWFWSESLPLPPILE